jgi:hypothetical protein
MKRKKPVLADEIRDLLLEAKQVVSELEALWKRIKFEGLDSKEQSID